MQEYITRNQAQNRLGCTKEMMRELLRSGEVSSIHKENGGWLVSVKSLDEYIRSNWSEHDANPLALQKIIVKLKAEIVYLRSLLDDNHIDYSRQLFFFERGGQINNSFKGAPEISLSLDDLTLSNRALNALRKNGIGSVHQLIMLSEKELLMCPGVGNHTLHNIKERLSDNGLSLI